MNRILNSRPCLTVLALLCPLAAWAQALTMVVAGPAGGTVDVAARRLGAQAANVLGETWVVSNAVGGNGVPARSVFDQSPARDTVLVLSDAQVAASALQGLSPAVTILTQSVALVGRAGVNRPSVVAHTFGEGSRARKLAEDIAQTLQATSVRYTTAVAAVADAKQTDTWVLVDGNGVIVAQRENLQVFAVGDKSLGLTDGNGQALGTGAQNYPSFTQLLGQPFPAASATITVYVQPASGQEVAAKLARLGMPAAVKADPLPAVVAPSSRPVSTDDPKARGRSARVM